MGTKIGHRDLIIAGVSCLFLAALSVGAVSADEDFSYSFSVRTQNWEEAPSVFETTQVFDENKVQIAGCDEHSYYLASSEAAQLTTAREEGAIVHLHKRPAGEPIDSAPIRCLMP